MFLWLWFLGFFRVPWVVSVLGTSPGDMVRLKSTKTGLRGRLKHHAHPIQSNVQMQGMRAVLEVNSMGRLSRIYGTTVAVAAIEAIKLLERLKVDDFIRVT